MEYFFMIFSMFFDAFISIIYMNGIMKKRKEGIPAFVFYIAVVIMEMLLSVNLSQFISLPQTCITFINSAISIITLFILCLFYDTSMKYRIFTALSFQVLASLGEGLFTIAVNAVNPDFFETADTDFMYRFMELGCTMSLFLLAIIVILIWNRKSSAGTRGFNMLALTTPVISLLILTPMAMKNDSLTHYTDYDTIIIVGLSVLNIVNYILVNQSQHITELTTANKQMEQQIAFQKEKYTQLGASYKNSRRVIHDTKKHYFAISEYIKNGNYSALTDYLKLAIDDLESTYAKFNTGNLVIDSFLTNYYNLATQNNITFNTELNVNYNRIPINDYDLCVILGNLLDNCINACNNIGLAEKFIYVEICTNDEDRFIIRTKNPIYDKDNSKSSGYATPFEHGYGLKNIENIVERNYGFVKCVEADDSFQVHILIPIIDNSKRINSAIY